MKTVARSISLSEELDRFALAEAEEGGYSSVSAYFADLLRQRRQAQIDADVKFLDSAVPRASGPAPVEDFVATCRVVRQKMLKERR